MTSPPPGPLFEAVGSKPTDVAHETDTPWENRYLLDPKRTWCGRVVYKRHHHIFTPKDLARVASKVQPTPETVKDLSWLERLLRFTFKLIFKIVPVPGWLEPFERPFIDWYVGVVNDGFSPGDYGTMVHDRTVTLLRECATILEDVVVDLVQEE